MDVYHNENVWGKGRTGSKLDAFPVKRTVLWGGQEIFIPAVYAGRAGAILDVCAKIPIEDMAAFLRKWNQERRLSLKTPEEYEQLDADNPSCRDFTVEMSLDGAPLTLRMSSNLNWYPEIVFQMGNENPAQDEEWENDKAAEKLMEAYGCDRGSCWHFGRLSYDWKEEPVLSPQEISLTFQARTFSVTAGHFTTGASCDGTEIRVLHPTTGQEYTLMLHGCEQTRQSFADIGAKGMIYPECFRILSYSITPEIDRSLFSIRDCADGDRPRKGNAPKESCSDSSDGPTAVFMAYKSDTPDRLAAASSLHFEPVEEIRWRMVFEIKSKDDMEIRLSVFKA